MIKDELEIQELSELIGKSTQGIYNRLNKKNNVINNYIVPNSNPRRFYKSVISEVYGIDMNTLERSSEDTTCKSSCTSSEQSSETECMQFKIELLERTIEYQKEELKNKNAVIENLTQLLDQQQQLALIDKGKIKELESKLLLPTSDVEQKKRWNILSIFNKKIKE